MGMRLPGSTSGLFDPKMVEQLIEAQRIPLKTAEQRKQMIVAKRDELGKLHGFIDELDSSLTGLRSKADFYKMKLESSHPEIIEGTVSNAALPGTYEFEVRGLAKNEKELAHGFADKDQTKVGFGFMSLQIDGKDPVEVAIEPGSTLEKVAAQINREVDGMTAMIINTGFKPEPYRLLVMSEESGKEARIQIDPDTTFMDFKEQVTGRNLDVLFEDVEITNTENRLEELLDGVVFDFKKSEPGEKIQVNITYDKEATLESIKTFVEKYNQIADFVHQQFELDQNDQAGLLAGDSSIKTILRSLQGNFARTINTGGKYRTLAMIGITTDSKTGKLNIDEAKVQQSLAEDYDSVAKLFIRTAEGDGIAQSLSETLKNFRDPGYGVMKSRMRSLDAMIRNSDKDIERKERQMAQKEESIKRRFAALEGRLSELQSQGNFLSQRLAQAPAPSG